MNQDLRHLLALLSIPGIDAKLIRQLIDHYGSARAVIEADRSTLLAQPRLAHLFSRIGSNTQLLDRADRELQFMADHHIQALVYGSEDYPRRLAMCPDAPAVLFQLGTSVLHRPHIVSIVGTRNCTQYGRDLTQRFIAELQAQIPDVVIVSGLAFGIDVSAHQGALACNVHTVGVVAHGLDRIYPSQHREVARQMIAQGGSVVTEYLTGTQPERRNFLARNRIIAGLADAVLVAESKDRGGSLVTASIALDYGRDVYAFPGRVGDNRSEGCNRLIRLNRAGLITSAEDFVEAMNWNTTHGQQKSIQHSIPFEEDDLRPNARLILDALRDRGDMLMSQLADATCLDNTTLYEELLDLEMDGKIRNTPGGLYQLRQP